MRISTKDEKEYIDIHATIEKQFKNVTKEEFDEFIASYPRQLERDVCGIYEPPIVSYNDLEIGWWQGRLWRTLCCIVTTLMIRIMNRKIKGFIE